MEPVQLAVVVAVLKFKQRWIKRMNAGKLIPLIACLFHPQTFAQLVVTEPPTNCLREGLICVTVPRPVELPGNSPEIIRRELLDVALIQSIGSAHNISSNEMATFRIGKDKTTDRLLLIYDVGKSGKAFDIMQEQLQKYATARAEGHTSAFAMAALTNQPPLTAITDPDLRIIATNRVLVPVLWLKKRFSETYTNKAGEVAHTTVSESVVSNDQVTRKETQYIPKTDEISRWTVFSVIDGDMEWNYKLLFLAGGEFFFFVYARYDAKESDPRFTNTIAVVEKEVAEEMDKRGNARRIGAIHSFWSLKKKKLKELGIDWHSPAELNPEHRYD